MKKTNLLKINISAFVLLLLFVLPNQLLMAEEDLPEPNSIQIVDFDLTIIGEDVQLSWTSFVHADYFEIQYATEADDKGDLMFQTITRIEAGTESTYSFTDNMTEKEGLMYYRIKEINGSETPVYSEIKTANFVNKDRFTMNVKPDPAFETISFIVNTHKPGTARLNISSITGNYEITKTLDLNKGTNNLKIQLPKELDYGAYLISFDFEGTSQVVLKQKVALDQMVVSFD